MTEGKLLALCGAIRGGEGWVGGGALDVDGGRAVSGFALKG